MSISTEIIKILDDICRRFGIVIDWTTDTVVPYVEDLAARLIQHEIQTSNMWCVVVLTLLGVLLLISIVCQVTSFMRPRSSCGDISEWLWCITACWFLISCVVVVFQIYNIITCNTLPEKIIFDFLKSALSNN